GRPPRRQGARQGDRRAGEARQPGGALGGAELAAAASRVSRMADLKPAYLIHGDDHGAIGERRAGLHKLAETDGGAEVLEGEQATPVGAARALATMTLAVGRRVIVVDGAERWREKDVEEHLGPALAAMPAETTIGVFAREEARAKAPPALHAAVKKAGGQVVAQMTVKPWELPKWVREQAPRLGLSLDAAAAKALVAQVGERQQRLLRELEKLALEGDPVPGGVARVRARRRARRRRRRARDRDLPAAARAGRARRGAHLPAGLQAAG